MRKQYYFGPSERGLLAWDVDRLIRLTATLPTSRVPLSQLRELDDPVFGDGEAPTWRSLVAHLQLIDDAELSFADVAARRFFEDPEPDYIGRHPADLPYGNDSMPSTGSNG